MEAPLCVIQNIQDECGEENKDKDLLTLSITEQSFTTLEVWRNRLVLSALESSWLLQFAPMSKECLSHLKAYDIYDRQS